MNKKKNISIIIPSYNEELAIEEVLREVVRYYKNSEIIVIDDGSTDTTKEKIGQFNTKVITHRKNRGYGAAIKTGIQNASNDIIVTIDADGEHSVKDIEVLLKDSEPFDMVVGKRTGLVDKKMWRKAGRYV
jgi:glycosyltransferase involved in cell wall biosynthesis